MRAVRLSLGSLLKSLEESDRDIRNCKLKQDIEKPYVSEAEIFCIFLTEFFHLCLDTLDNILSTLFMKSYSH